MYAAKQGEKLSDIITERNVKQHTLLEDKVSIL